VWSVGSSTWIVHRVLNGDEWIPGEFNTIADYGSRSVVLDPDDHVT